MHITKKALCNNTHTAYLVYDENTVIGAGVRELFSSHAPHGITQAAIRAYIMNMYTRPEYRRKGIASKVLDMLVKECRARGITAISLEATDMRLPLYEKYGFIKMEHEMELPENTEKEIDNGH